MNKIKINNSKFTILDALKVLNLNPIGYIIFENLDLKVLGILTEGDIRRLILKKISLNVDIKKYINKNFFFIDLEKINNLKKHQLLLKKIKFLPILENSKLKQIVTNSDRIPVMQPNIRGNELKYILNCIESNWISSQGSYVLKLENKFSKFHNLKYSLATSSGTSALELAIKSLSLPKNSRIIVPNLTFAAVINAVINCGHKPIIMDVNADDWLLDIKQIKKNIPSHTKAVIFVHLYGISKDLSVFYSFCKRNKIKLIEDCAEALGGKINNKKVGTMGDISIFSFFSNKLITTGEGGMAMFKDKNNYILAKSIRDHGMDKSKRYWHTSIGNNYRLTNIQAAIGCAQMERITIFLNYRTKVNKW
ncbi:aminotransferase class I/II-fold pyridoxal phosphate-dependent enzyme, partial [Alphaproteobacteria bacterium]|nr:aminotransferase class I/II-fold pyridoxal phosphate-dependent enzyme [Alphaproteobacteria bacterium]